MPQTPAKKAGPAPWSLEVLRGRDVGKVFEVRGAEFILGNGIDGATGLDLRDQEAGSPRRMAPRHAVLESRGSDLFIRDLDSPGGTFVNRQRLLGGQARRLLVGDEIQLAGVLLRLGGSARPSAASAPASPPPPPPPVPRPQPPVPVPSAVPGRLSEPYTIQGTVACRTWDDFLVVAAQRWVDLRNELISGRLAEYLLRVQRNDLLPRGASGGPADEQLDEWLGRLPVSRSSAPELDVHPDKLEVPSSGGTTRHVLRITNVGYRLLRSKARVEPAVAGWIRIASPYDGRAFPTIEDTELTIEVEAPERGGDRRPAEVVIESNGGTRRIPVRIVSPQGPPALPDALASSPGPAISEVFRPVAVTLAGIRLPARLASGILAALALRLLVLAAGLVALGTRGASLLEPRLPAIAALCAGVGALIGLMAILRRDDRGLGDMASAVVSGACFGVLAAALLHAVVRAVERPIGDWSTSFVAVGLLWAALGAAIAGLSSLILPFRQPSAESSK